MSLIFFRRIGTIMKGSPNRILGKSCVSAARKWSPAKPKTRFWRLANGISPAYGRRLLTPPSPALQGLKSETISRGPSLPSQTKANRNKRSCSRHCAFRPFVPVNWSTGGEDSWESGASRSSDFLSSTRVPWDGNDAELLPGAAAKQKVSREREDRIIKARVGQDGDAQEPAKGPRERSVRLRHDELGEFQAGGKESDQRRRNLRLDGHGNR